MPSRAQSTENWLKYHASGENAILHLLQRRKLNAFQTVMMRALNALVFEVSKGKTPVRVLSFGSGIDYIAFRLKKRFGEDIALTVLDISPECIETNRRLFGEIAEYVVGDVFTYRAPERVDIVYNTGLLEHFLEEEQREIIENVRRQLRPSGHYLTLNPNANGRLYVACAEVAKRKGRWPFGLEVPLTSLSVFSQERFRLIEERGCCSLFQLCFLFYAGRLLFPLLLPLIVWGRFFFWAPLDAVAGRRLGFYGLLSLFRSS